jgi:hypothetical protein
MTAEKGSMSDKKDAIYQYRLPPVLGEIKYRHIKGI